MRITGMIVAGSETVRISNVALVPFCGKYTVGMISLRKVWVSTKCCAPRDPRGLRRVRHWFDSARVPGPCAGIPRNVRPSYPSFVFGLLSPIENPSLVGEGLARAESDPAGANGERRGAAPGRRAATPVRTTWHNPECLPLIQAFAIASSS